MCVCVCVCARAHLTRFETAPFHASYIDEALRSFDDILNCKLIANEINNQMCSVLNCLVQEYEKLWTFCRPPNIALIFLTRYLNYAVATSYSGDLG
jgi:hypothetical protein